MTKRRARSSAEVRPLEPSGPCTSAAEVSRAVQERDADLHAERRLLVSEVLIILLIALVVMTLQGMGT